MAEKDSSLCETQSEVEFEWELKDFFPLCEEKKKCFRSPLFYFSGSSWECNIYPNGRSDEAEGWISLYLKRMSTGYPVYVKYTLIIETVDGTIYTDIKSKHLFVNKNDVWGSDKFILRSHLLKKKSRFTATNDILIIYNLKNRERKNVAGSLFARQREVSDNMFKTFTERKRTDFTIKVDGYRIPVHRMILETRSPVFAAMFNHDTDENQTGEMSIIDIDLYTMLYILQYMYSGDIDSLNTKNALTIYSAAEKYDIKDLKNICFDFIVTNLSEDFVCDVMEVAELFQDKEIFRRAIYYFKENSEKILASDKWEKIAEENPTFSNKVLSHVLKAFSAKKMRTE